MPALNAIRLNPEFKAKYRTAVGLGFASYGVHEARPNAIHVEKRFEDTSGRKQS
jgi:hypothetical protein